MLCDNLACIMMNEVERIGMMPPLNENRVDFELEMNLRRPVGFPKKHKPMINYYQWEPEDIWESEEYDASQNILSRNLLIDELREEDEEPSFKGVF